MILRKQHRDGINEYRMMQEAEGRRYGVAVNISDIELRNLERPRVYTAMALLRARKYLRQSIQAAVAVEQHKPVFDYDFLERSFSDPKIRTATRG